MSDLNINEDRPDTGEVKLEKSQQEIMDAVRSGQRKPIRVYLAILNNGPLRREMTSKVIPAMNKTPGVQVVWENPDITWANPISSNRNKIVKRFLETDCDFLLMIDDDVVPLHNPCELVYVNKDVIGCPALVRTAGQLMVWTAYIPHAGGVGYSAIDLDSFDDMFDILEVAIVGSGCMLIKREVLENVKAPFHSEFDENGILTHGTDFAFCRKARDAGYQVYTTTHRRCEHFKKVGLSDITAWDCIDYFDRANMKYNIPWGEYSITSNDWHFIKSFILALKPKRVLEFGCGLSSLLISEFCEVVSYETSKKYAELTKAKRTSKNDLLINLWDGFTVPEDINLDSKDFDLVFIDGPQQKLKGGMGRDMSIYIASKVSDHVIVHDAGRSEEEQAQRKHLRCIFRLVRKSGTHITRCHYWERRPFPVTLEDVRQQLHGDTAENTGG